MMVSLCRPAQQWRGSAVEVGVQDPDLGDAVHGELVGLGGPADGLWGGAVVDAERGLLVGGHIGVDPGDPSAALPSTTSWQALAPPSSIGMASPSGKLRSTRYRGMAFSSRSSGAGRRFGN